MSQFGDQLRYYRNRSVNPRSKKALSQEQLGRLLGEVLEDQGYTGQAVSDWERGKSKIHADDRRVLVGLLQVLHDGKGLQSIVEADALLLAGNYRPLDADEQRQVFPDEAFRATKQSLSGIAKGPRRTSRALLGVVIVAGGGSWLVRRWPTSDTPVSFVFSLLTLLTIFRRRK